MIISGKAIKAAVIGDPISHSLSPQIHNYWLEQNKIDGVYIALKIHPEDLQDCVQSLVKMGFAGFNVTLPHKEEIFKICQRKSKSAEFCKAVNTVIITSEGELFGHNSDVDGFINNLKENAQDFDLKDKIAFVIGAGGAARAAIYGLIKEGVRKIYITNRNEKKAIDLIADFNSKANIVLEFLNQIEFEERLKECDLLVNTTSLGMENQPPLLINLDFLPKSAIVYDIVYKPLMTELLSNAQNRGNKIVTGIGMLLHQAVVGFEAWFKVKPEIDQSIKKQIS